MRRIGFREWLKTKKMIIRTFKSSERTKLKSFLLCVEDENILLRVVSI